MTPSTVFQLICAALISFNHFEGTCLDEGFCKGKQDGNYKDPHTCFGFIACSGGNTNKMPCPDGLMFNEEKNMCDYPENTECEIPEGERDSPDLDDLPCGIRPPMSRIVGGETAIPHSWPWQAELLIKNETTGQFSFKCGSTLVTPQYVVTAAHCVFGVPFPQSYQIRLGVHDRTVSDQVQSISVSEIHINKRAMTKGYGDDIALIKLSRPALLNGRVGLACLPSGRKTDRVTPGTMCYLTGWGSSSFQGEKSKILMQAKMPIVDYNACAQANKNLGEVVDTSMVCAGYGGDSKISGCHGDSGGPLVCQDKNTGRWTLRGAVSWGDHYCNGGPTYSVFVRINSYIDWIKCKMTSQPLQPPEDCVDIHDYCGTWKGYNLCENSYFRNMLKTFYCKKTCNAC
ncbi:chymotrypsin-like elastase family member 3B [Oculina patagonica]